jgi:hypothetical protein
LDRSFPVKDGDKALDHVNDNTLKGRKKVFAGSTAKEHPNSM